MNRLKLLLPALLLGLLAACHNQKPEPEDENKGLLPASLVHNPHSANGLDSAIISDLPVLVFPDTLYNFGKIQSGEKVEHTFTFRNAGGGPLIISGAEGSCGCTAADYPREPLAPGATASMKVIFNSAGKQGHIEKSVTISSNSASGTRRLYIQAEVTPGTE